MKRAVHLTQVIALIGLVGRSPWTAADALVRPVGTTAKGPAAGEGPAPHGHHDDAYLSQVDSLLYLLEWRGVVWMELVDMARLPGRYFS
jgi:hypothetical protein